MNKKHALILFIILSVSVTGLFVYAADALTITAVSLERGTVGEEYHAQITASGGTEPYYFSVKDGSLPDGLQLNSLTGEISGIPTRAGAKYVTFGVTDQEGSSAEKTLRMGVNAISVDFTISSTSYVYDGTPKKAVVTPSVQSLIEGEDFTVTYGGSSQQSDAGSYKISIVMNNNGYRIGNLSASYLQIFVNPSSEISLTSQSFVFDGAPHELDASVSPAGLSYAVTYRGTGNTEYPETSEPPSKAGSYLVTAKTTNANYVIRTSTATLQITPRPVDFVVTGERTVYQKGTAQNATVVPADPNFSIPYVVTYDNVSTTAVEAVSQVENAGRYRINIEFPGDGYTVGNLSTEYFEILPEKVNFSVSDNQVRETVDGGPYSAVVTPVNPDFTNYRVFYLKDGESFENQITAAGVYVISVVSEDSNYEVGTVSPDSFTVEPLPYVSFTVSDHVQEYRPGNTGYRAVVTPSIAEFRDYTIEYVKDGTSYPDVTEYGTYEIKITLTTNEYGLGEVKDANGKENPQFILSKRPIDFTITQTTATQSAAQVEYQAAVTPSVEGFTGYSVFYEGADGSTCGAVTVPGVYAIHIELTEEGKKNNELRRITPNPAEFTLYEAEPEPEPDVYSIRLDYGNSPYGAIMGMNWSEQAKLAAKEAFAANRVFSADTVPDGYRSGLTYSALAWVGGSGAEGAAPAPNADADLDETAVFVYGGIGGYIEPGYTVEKDGGTAVRTGAENGTVTVTVKQLKVGAEAPKDVVVGSEEWNALKGKWVVPGIYSVEYFYQTQASGATASAVRTAVFLDRIGDANSDGTTNGIDGNYLKRLIQNGTEAADAVIRYRIYDVNHDGAVDEADSAAILNRMNQPLNEYYR